MPAKPALKKILGQPSWRIATPRVEAYVTQIGGHLGPVIFDRAGKKIAPLSIAPWVGEAIDRSAPPLIKVLRGDFFCMPFGGNETPFQGEEHPPHGETANSPWMFESLTREDARTTLNLTLRARVRPATVKKSIALPDDHDAVYQRHIVSGASGPMNFGHHAMLKFPDEEGAGRISTSRFVHAQVFPQPVELPQNRGYSLLKPDATFKSLEKVPTITGEMTDLSRYPARRGFEDIVMLVADDKLPFGWTAVAFPAQGYVWFALKDPRVLRETVFWISNGGRHYAPWSGRHVNVMGLEEVTANFHSGLAESVKANPIARRGFPTHTQLDPKRPLIVNYIFGVAPIPRTFERVAGIESAAGGIVIRDDAGKKVRAPIDIGFLNQPN
jgi:hypothetical protein